MEDRAAELRARAIGLEALYELNDEISGIEVMLNLAQARRIEMLVELQASGFSFRELARACGVTRNTLQRWLAPYVPNYYTKATD